ncbi:MAG: phosphate ABC transporter ATP-binding protein [Spirochaetae bacterium HGW-Spirochaetae-3]|jgi:D-methionine transport system ATP-binding protein|nr:MAG: phosphate ABC transporter ATP-binding protein [Spirochaetae bacterium HGW-Spirochaetae-3]
MFHAERPLKAALPTSHPSIDDKTIQAASLPGSKLELRSLTKSFGGKAVVRDASISVRPGAVYGVIGRSGAGKSTLLRMAALLETPDTGIALYGGSPVSGLAGRALLLARRRAGVVFQSFNLFGSRTAAGNVAFPLEAAGAPKAAARERVAMLLDLVGLADKADKPVGRFSGGEKQRVAIARALANEPEILFCDEATSALDPETTRSVLDLLLSIRDRLGLTVLMVTHQMEVVRRVCDEVAVMDAGRIVETGTVESLFASPRTKAAKRLVADLLPLEAEELEDDPVCRLRFAGKSASQPVLSRLSREFPVEVNILRGTIHEAGGSRFGELVVTFQGEDAAIAAAKDWLKSQGVAAESAVTGEAYHA